MYLSPFAMPYFVPNNQNVPQSQRAPFKVEDCLEKMVQYIKTHNLQPIFGKDLSDEELKFILHPEAEAASKLPMKLNDINRGLLMQLAVMSLYDLVVLVGRFPP